MLDQTKVDSLKSVYNFLSNKKPFHLTNFLSSDIGFASNSIH